MTVEKSKILFIYSRQGAIVEIVKKPSVVPYCCRETIANCRNALEKTMILRKLELVLRFAFIRISVHFGLLPLWHLTSFLKVRSLQQGLRPDSEAHSVLI